VVLPICARLLARNPIFSAYYSPTCRKSTRTREERFLEMLPQIRAQARYAFRKELPARRQELIAEVIANCWIAFVRLLDRGLEDVI